jgi:hypothetical protein
VTRGAEADGLGELARLQDRLAHLEGWLREHGFEPDEPGQPSGAG